MVWTLEFDAQARKMLRKLPNHIGDRIISALVQIIERGDPRDRGGAMTGDYNGYWRYRIGDYRAIARIEEGRMTVTVITIGHRREVYRG